MNSHQIKAILNRWCDLFGHASVSRAAGVAPSQMSTYRSYDPVIGKEIQALRLFMIQDDLHVTDFTDAVIEERRAEHVEASDPRPVAARTLAALSDTFGHLHECLDDDNLTETEKRQALANAAALNARSHELSTIIAAMPTGRVKLKAV